MRALEYLVFSSHKTGTQTLNLTLNRNGLKCKHGHALCHVPVERGGLLEFCRGEQLQSGKKVTVLSVFREPMERHISSFFQAHGTRPIRRGEARDETETLIYRSTVEELVERFGRELEERSLIGYEESLHELCREIGMETGELEFDEEELFSRMEFEAMDVCLMRFDRLFLGPEAVLSAITGQAIRMWEANKAEGKWYASRYVEFKRRLRLPSELLRRVYEDKRELMECFYPGRFGEMVEVAIRRYGRSGGG